jgi:hypothetical protein
MKAALRDRLADVRAFGLALVAVWQGGRHIRITVRAPDGREATLSVSISPNDVGRARQCFRSELKRLVRGDGWGQPDQIMNEEAD